MGNTCNVYRSIWKWGERMVELEMENRYGYEYVGRMDREQPKPTRRMDVI